MLMLIINLGWSMLNQELKDVALLIDIYHIRHGVFPSSIEDLKQDITGPPSSELIFDILKNTNDFTYKFVCSSNGEVVITITKPQIYYYYQGRKISKKVKIPDDVEKVWNR